MHIDDMVSAVADAREVIRSSESLTRMMAELIAGKLRSSEVSCYTLEVLKRELKDFNIHTYLWKERK